MSYEKIVTLFDNAEHAEAAMNNLIRAGFSADEISVISSSEGPKSGDALPGTGAPAPADRK